MGLTDIISAEARRVLYVVYAFLGLGLGAVQVAYSAAAVGQPTWLTVALSVFAFLGVGLGFTAAANAGGIASGFSGYTPAELHQFGIDAVVQAQGGVASDVDVATDLGDEYRANMTEEQHAAREGRDI